VILFEFFTRVLDIVSLPRRTERLVRELDIKVLRALTLRGEKSGSLPYHDERVRALVWEVKYYASPYSCELAGTILADVLKAVAIESLGTPLLIPVPMHKRRRRQRGHNQTELLCDSALRSLGGVGGCFFEYRKNVLIRIKHTKPQQSLPKETRKENLKFSMLVPVAQLAVVRGRTCVVVDDVSTTGATFKEAARALRAAGAAHVECIALAYS
jgi:ComF family protein